MLSPCRVCPRACGADRLAGKTGACGIGAVPRVTSAGAHFGEEPVLVGMGGSGTIFFQGCNLSCVFCQNYDISQLAGGVEVSARELSDLMLGLQQRSCSNVNLVTPTHVVPQAMEAIDLARGRGLRLPIVYNCGGFESVEMLALLEGCVDIYMPDFKYASPEAALKYSDAENYPQVARQALAEMYRQVGPLELEERGVAVRGVMVRHLVLPMDIAGSEQVIETIAEVAPGCGINVMGQYRPCYRASEFPELLQPPPAGEIRRLRQRAEAAGLQRVD